MRLEQTYKVLLEVPGIPFEFVCVTLLAHVDVAPHRFTYGQRQQQGFDVDQCQ